MKYNAQYTEELPNKSQHNKEPVNTLPSRFLDDLVHPNKVIASACSCRLRYVLHKTTSRSRPQGGSVCKSSLK